MRAKQNLFTLCAFASMVWTGLGTAVLAQDWPQWMGPHRDNVWREEGIIDKFPADGPTVLWRTPIRGG